MVVNTTYTTLPNQSDKNIVFFFFLCSTSEFIVQKNGGKTTKKARARDERERERDRRRNIKMNGIKLFYNLEK